jgi:hypothetical protein
MRNIFGKNNPNYGRKWTNKQRELASKRTLLKYEEHLIIWDKDLPIHYIDYDKFNCNKYNLITLCKQCHLKTNFNRDYWIEYFEKMLVLKLED